MPRGQSRKAQRGATVVELNGNPDQAERGQPHGGRHAAYLSVPSLAQAEFQPIGGNRLTRSDGRYPWAPGNVLEPSDPCLVGHVVLDPETPPQLIQLVFSRYPLHLHVVSAPVGPAGLTQAGLKGAMGGENQQTLTVRIESAGGVDTRDGENLRKGGPAAVGLWGELAEHPIGLVQQKGLQGRWRWGRAQTIRLGTVLC
jgi:hypothetical protein